MKKLKTFEEHDNPYLHQPNVDNTTFPPPSSGSFGSADDDNLDENGFQDQLDVFNDTLYDEFQMLVDKLREEFPFCKDWTLHQFANHLI